MRKIVKKGDFILLVILLLVAGLFFALGNSGKTATSAEIICNNETVLRIDLTTVNKEYEETLPNGMILCVSQNGIRVLSSDCKDKLCIHCGQLSEDGDIAVCLPNRTFIKVSGEKQKDAPDIITY